MTENHAKRPIGVWIISLLFFIFVPLALIGSYIGINAKPELLKSFSTIELILSFAIIPILNLAAAANLFLLKKQAFWIFVLATLVSGIPLIYRALIGDMGIYAKYYDEHLLKNIVQLFVWGLMMLYIWNMKTQGVLK